MLEGVNQESSFGSKNKTIFCIIFVIITLLFEIKVWFNNIYFIANS